MALALTPGLGTETEQTLAVANEALEITWGTKPPRLITLFLDGAAGGYAFAGTDGSALGTDRADIPASTSYVIELRNGTARSLGVTSLFVESDGTSIGLQITTEA